jgi:hypothetical protein
VTGDDKPPTSSGLTDIVHEALSQPVQRPSLWQRFRSWLSRQRSKLATMGGYWGGVTMRWRDKP